MKPATKFLDLADIRMAYRESGDGPTLILLHGNSESKNLFIRYQTRYFPMFHTFALDSRAHGESESSDESLSYERMADDVLNFCDKSGISDARVLGYSDGGILALYLAKKAPGRFKKIIAVSPNYLLSGLTDGAIRLIGRISGMLAFLVRIGVGLRKARMRFDLMIREVGLSAQDLRGIEDDILILYAEKDIIREEHIQDMGRLIPGATVKRIGGCSHLSIMSKPETLVAIKRYLGSPD